MRFHLRLPLVFAVLLGLSAAIAQAQTPSVPCRVPDFRRATATNAFTDAQMFVMNVGRDCGITIYGKGATRENPAQALTTLKEPSNGALKLLPPRISYTPTPGFVGDDMFEFEALAQNSDNQPFRMLVRVRVSVSAP
jgi:hypothetical protein